MAKTKKDQASKQNKKIKKTKKTDRAITIEDLAELLVAMDRKVTELENELKSKNDVLARIRDRMGV